MNKQTSKNSTYPFDYFCYTVPNPETNDFTIKDTDDEDTTWTKTQESQLITKTIQLDKLIVYDRTTKKFYKNNQEISINGLKLFPRSLIKWEKDLLQAISLNNGISLATQNDLEIIDSWPQYVQPLFRPVIIATYQEFLNNWSNYKKRFPKIFFKTAIKSSNSYVLNFYG